MKNILKTLSVFLILLTACISGDKKLFWIAEPSGHENDFLYMAESTNVPELPPDSLTFYLTSAEILSGEKLTFKNFGTIYKNRAFRLLVLLEEGSGAGRDYTFILRTYDKNFKIIDSYELAAWQEEENRFCFGSIDAELTIKRICEGTTDVRRITNEGRIIAISDHGSD
ncbi:MAG: hypothetical protein DWQ02_03860 [Bacteroidetes bacterium]|nr:MAG: hypothetical protein DWQ02_03860 [Bacteroidota bacterium]